MAYWFRHGLCYTTQSFMAISLFTVWLPTMIGACQALSVLISVVIFRFFVGHLPFTFSIYSQLQLHLSSFAMPVVTQIIVTFYHATGP